MRRTSSFRISRMAAIPHASSKVIWLRFQRVLPVQGDWEHECKLTLGLGWTSRCIVAGLIAGVSLTSRVAWLKRSPTPHPEMREEVDRAAKAAFDRVPRGPGDTGNWDSVVRLASGEDGLGPW